MKTMKKIATTVALGALCSSGFSTGAMAGSLDTIRVNGFATAAGVMTDDESVQFLGAGDDLKFNADTIVGLQFHMPVNKRVSFTTQIIARGFDNYDAELEWAYATMKLGGGTNLRAGRLRIPFFMISDSLEVGYSYPWIRPPVEVYGQLSFNRFDGVDLLWRGSAGDFDISAQPIFGSTEQDQNFLSYEGELEVTNLWGVNFNLSNDWMSVRLGHVEGDFSLFGFDDVDNFVAGLGAAGFSSVAERFSVSDRHGKFTGLGVDIDYNNFKIMSEYTERETDGLIADTSAWYFTAGYRIGKFMPHITFAEFETEEDYSTVEAQYPAMAAVDPSMSLVGGSAQFIQVNNENQESITVGLRWNFMPKAALKFEWQMVDVEDGSGPVSTIYSSSSDEDFDVITIGLDLVF
ncbi:MAG: hypothetical protein K6L73_11780 [Cellvibrionaceae bacterium]